MRLAILILVALFCTMCWGTVGFGILFGITHEPRFGEDTVICFGSVIALLLILIGLFRYSVVRRVRH